MKQFFSLHLQASANKLILLCFLAGLITIQPAFSQDINTLSAKEKKEGWQLLFNGKNFDGWRGVNKAAFPEKGWKVVDGAITCTGKNGGSIITKKKYGDFELKWDWKIVSPGANSGLKYFVAERGGDTGGYGYGIEYQILDDAEYISSGSMDPNDYHTVGAAYELYAASPKKKVNPPGKWNSSKIISRNGKVEHWLNGKKILEYDRFSNNFKQKVAESKFKDVKNFGVHPKGHILLQDHNSEVYFRNIKMKEL